MNIAEIHHKAEKLRENEKYFEALEIFGEVWAKCLESKDYQRLVEVIQGEIITYKHLYWLGKDKIYVVIAKKLAELAVEIATNKKLTKVAWGAYFRRGEVFEIEDKLQMARKDFRKAIELYKTMDANMAHLYGHLGEIEYRLGNKKKGIDLIKKSVEIIRKNLKKMDEYCGDVWLSGNLMKLAVCLWKEDKKQAKEILTEVKTIVSKEKLKIRRKQYNELVKNLEKGKRNVGI